jgi:hypothetical protein
MAATSEQWFRGLWEAFREANGVAKVKDDRHLKSKTARARAKAHGYRSGLELAVAEELQQAGVEFLYEPFKVPFVRPPKPSKYTPDIILPNGIVIELKGRFTTDDRQKHLMIQDQYPDLDIRFVFSNPNQRLSKQSKTTYAKWCDTKGFRFAKCSIPQRWIREKPKARSLQALGHLMETQHP